MKRNAPGPLSKKSRRHRGSIDISTQTDPRLLSAEFNRPAFVLLDKNTVNEFLQRQLENKEVTVQVSQVDEQSNPDNIAKLVTTTYSTFLKPITNNELANSTLSDRNIVTPPVRKRGRRKVKFFRPKQVRNKARKTSVSTEQNIEFSLIRDASGTSELLDPILERTEVHQECLNEENRSNDIEEHHSMELSSTNVLEILPESSFRQNTALCLEGTMSYSKSQSCNKETNTSDEYDEETHYKYDCVKISAHTVNIYNNFYNERSNNE